MILVQNNKKIIYVTCIVKHNTKLQTISSINDKKEKKKKEKLFISKLGFVML